MKKEKLNNANPKSQSAMLQQIVKQTYTIVAIGIAFLLILIRLYAYTNHSKNEQLENTVYLNQYRLGSKILTSAVQSYAVTGDQTYYDNYQKELNEDKNRDIAWDGLKSNGLKSNEWDELNSVADMSQGLVPLEVEDDSEVGTMVKAINFMNRNFTRMISEISDTLGKMGNGNYNVQLTEQYVGEFVAIKDSMLKIISDTKNTLVTIRNSATEIDGGSEQLASAASDLAEGCTVI